MPQHPIPFDTVDSELRGEPVAMDRSSAAEIEGRTADDALRRILDALEVPR
jgi:CTP:molybdopterin cytidylyltransferase MocA